MQWVLGKAPLLLLCFIGVPFFLLAAGDEGTDANQHQVPIIPHHHKMLITPGQHASKNIWCHAAGVPSCPPEQEEVLRSIYATQNPVGVDCSSAKLLAMHMEGIGFGGELGCWSHALMQAHKRNRILVTTGSTPYVRGCIRPNSIECFFFPYSDICNSSHIRPDEPIVHINDPGADDARIVTFSLWRDDKLFYHDLIDFIENYPEKYRPKGIPWWRTNFVLYTWRMQPDIHKYVREEKKALGWPEDKLVISIHLRRGDKQAVEGFPGYDLPVYYEAMKRYRELYGVTHVFASSDDESLLKRMPMEWPDFTIMFRGDFRRTGQTTVAAAFVAGESDDGWKMGLDAITNMFLIAEGNFFIGTTHSNFGRTGAELQFIKGHTQGPMTILDAAWCKEQGHSHPDTEAYSRLPHTYTNRTKTKPKGEGMPGGAKMPIIAAYLLAGLGGNENPKSEDLTKILSSAGIEEDKERLEQVLQSLQGVNEQSVSEGSSQTPGEAKKDEQVITYKK